MKDRLTLIQNQRQEKFAKIAKFVDPSITFASALSTPDQSGSSVPISTSNLRNDLNDQTVLLQANMESLLNNFKTSLLSLISNELNEIKKSVQKNTDNIDIILDTLYSQTGSTTK